MYVVSKKKICMYNFVLERLLIGLKIKLIMDTYLSVMNEINIYQSAVELSILGSISVDNSTLRCHIYVNSIRV